MVLTITLTEDILQVTARIQRKMDKFVSVSSTHVYTETSSWSVDEVIFEKIINSNQ